MGRMPLLFRWPHVKLLRQKQCVRCKLLKLQSLWLRGSFTFFHFFLLFRICAHCVHVSLAVSLLSIVLQTDVIQRLTDEKARSWLKTCELWHEKKSSKTGCQEVHLTCITPSVSPASGSFSCHQAVIEEQLRQERVQREELSRQLQVVPWSSFFWWYMCKELSVCLLIAQSVEWPMLCSLFRPWKKSRKLRNEHSRRGHFHKSCITSGTCIWKLSLWHALVMLRRRKTLRKG